MMIKNIFKSTTFIMLVLCFIMMTFGCENNRTSEKEEDNDGSHIFYSEYIDKYFSIGKKADDLSDDDVEKIIEEISLLSLSETSTQVDSLCDYLEKRIQSYVNYDTEKDTNVPKNIAFILENYDRMAAIMRHDAIFTYLYYRSNSTYYVPEDLASKACDFWEKKDVDKIAKRWYWKGDSGEESFVHKVSSEMYASLGKDFDARVRKQLGWNGFAQEGDCSFMV